jgi:hypothetical protein
MKENNLVLGLKVFMLLLMGGLIYLGISNYMLTTYQLTAKASNLIGLISTCFYYSSIILVWILSKVVPKLYNKHHDSENQD